MTKHFGATLSALALAVVVSGCAGGSGTTTTTTPAAATTAATSAASTPASPSTAGSATAGSATPVSAAVLKTASTSAGKVVVDAKGMSVYVFTKDTKDSGTSACTGQCMASWPPVLTDSATPAVDGVSGKIGTIATPDGKKQVTINGMPVYYFAKDRAPGDVSGQGVGNVWYLVNPAGDMVTAGVTGGY